MHGGQFAYTRSSANAIATPKPRTNPELQLRTPDSRLATPTCDSDLRLTTCDSRLATCDLRLATCDFDLRLPTCDLRLSRRRCPRRRLRPAQEAGHQPVGTGGASRQLAPPAGPRLQ